ncbi:MAG: HU family DNA-binding protein [Candidatus Marinimicrobia bacterium]|nr:HU family DNA-binding protein [Candidatus Neomarinimicrobiota bacterium]
MSKITFSELIEQVSGATGLSKQVCHVVLRGLAETIEEGLVRDGQVRLKGLGTFRLRRVAQRKGINPRTGQPIEIREHNKVVFHPQTEIKNKLNKDLSQTPKPIIVIREPVQEPVKTRSIKELWQTNKIFQYGTSAAALALIILFGSLWLGGGDSNQKDLTETVVALTDEQEPIKTIVDPEPLQEEPDVAPPEQVIEIIPDDSPEEIAIEKPHYQSHMIQSGDNLWTIAEEYYGDPYLWPLIYERNKDVIANPDLLIPGSDVFIPALEGSAAELEKSDIEGLAKGNALAYLVYSQNNTPGAQDFLKVALKLDPGITEKLGIDQGTGDILVTKARE